MMFKWTPLLIVAITTPTMAARCPYGQIYRVHLDECVSWHSKLAIAYVGRHFHLPAFKHKIYKPIIVPVADPPPLPVVESIYPPEVIYKLQQELKTLKTLNSVKPK